VREQEKFLWVQQKLLFLTYTNVREQENFLWESQN